MIKDLFRKRFSLIPQSNGGFLLTVLLIFILGFQLGHRSYSLEWSRYKPKITVSNQKSLQDTDIDFKLFWDTWDLVSRKYIDKSAIDSQKMYYGAIQGMVAAVGDPYTSFLPPDSQKATKETLGGSFEGVGIQLGFNKDKRLVVIAPLKGTPAQKAGILAGDLILKINNKDTSSLSLPDAVNVIRGTKGSDVTLTTFREDDGKPKDLTITRDTIIVKSVELESKSTQTGKKVAIVKLSRFGEKTHDEWDEAVNGVFGSDYQGMVLDLRNNPGGFLDSAVYIASEFIDSGTVAIQEDGQGQRRSFPVVRIGKLLKTPLVVLINKGSASASEIVAGAVQDKKRGTLVGEQSFGKGTIQSSEDLPGGTGIHITTAKWLTPNNRWIHNIGLTPDVKIEAGEDQSKDLQLDEALMLLDQ